MFRCKNFTQKIKKKYPPKFGAQLFHAGGQTDGQTNITKLKRDFSQFCERAEKQTLLPSATSSTHKSPNLLAGIECGPSAVTDQRTSHGKRRAFREMFMQSADRVVTVGRRDGSFFASVPGVVMADCTKCVRLCLKNISHSWSKYSVHSVKLRRGRYCSNLTCVGTEHSGASEFLSTVAGCEDIAERERERERRQLLRVLVVL